MKVLALAVLCSILCLPSHAAARSAALVQSLASRAAD
jgi:hypothetical protein